MNEKLPLSLETQVLSLQARGLVIKDFELAKKQLSVIGYYRFAGYMQPFACGATWDMVSRLYLFDKKLRLLVFEVMECLEIAFRTQIAYQLGQKYGAYWQENSDIFKEKRVHGSVFAELQNLSRKKFSSPPPSWEFMESLCFGHLSRICSSLKNRADINGISSFFDMPPSAFCSWLHSLNFARNLCAHHIRLWNRYFCIIPENLSFSKHLKWIKNQHTVKRNKAYFLCCMLNYLLQTANPSSSFNHSLKFLLHEYKDVVILSDMGFPVGWENESFWNV